MTLPVDIEGRGPPVALLHGAPTSVDVLAPLAAALASSRRVLVLRMPGYGGAPPLDPPYDLARARAAIEETLLTHDAAEAALVGFSGGAFRALDLALGGRLRPTHVVCLAGFAALEAPEQEGLRQFAAAARAGVDLRGLAPARFLSPAFAAAHPEARAAVTAWLDAAPRAVIADELEGFAAAPSLLPRLGDLRVPLLARTGALDAAAPPAKAEALAGAVRDAVLEIVPEVGHALLIEDAEATIASVGRFLGARA